MNAGEYLASELQPIVGQVLTEKDLFFRPIGIQWVFYFPANVPLIIPPSICLMEAICPVTNLANGNKASDVTCKKVNF